MGKLPQWIAAIGWLTKRTTTLSCPSEIRDRVQGLTTTHQGQQAEAQAARFLKRQGLKPVAKNFRCRFGEIDLIMKDKDCTVFVEVRYRQHNSWANAAESIDNHKQNRLIKAAEHFLQQHGLSDFPCRFDAVTLTANHQDVHINWITNAIALDEIA